MLDLATFKPVFHVSSKYPASIGCCALVAPVAQHPVNRNAVVVFDLRQDPDELINASPETIRQRVFSSQADLGETPRFALKAVHINKCPVLAPATMLKSLSPERLEALHLDGEVLRAHLQKLRKAPGLSERIAEAFAPQDEGPGDLTDPDEQLYAGGFLTPADRKRLDQLLREPVAQMAEATPEFDDERLEEMVFRFRARNYPDTLQDEEQERWETFRQERLLNPKKGWRSLEVFFADIQTRLQAEDLSSKDRTLLEELALYGESIIPYA